MTKKDITGRLEELSKLRFMLSMKDRWSNEDYDRDAKWSAEERRLNAELAALVEE